MQSSAENNDDSKLISQLEEEIRNGSKIKSQLENEFGRLIGEKEKIQKHLIEMKRAYGCMENNLNAKLKELIGRIEEEKKQL